MTSTGFGYAISILWISLGFGLILSGHDQGNVLIFGMICAMYAWSHGNETENNNAIDRIVGERRFKHRGRYYEVEDVSDEPGKDT